MRVLGFITAVLAVIAGAYWAYLQNFETKQAQKRVRALQEEVAYLHEAIALQRAEWAYLNRPERLRDLADLNFDSLELLPMSPAHLGAIEEIPAPLSPDTISQDGQLSDAEMTSALSQPALGAERDP